MAALAFLAAITLLSAGHDRGRAEHDVCSVGAAALTDVAARSADSGEPIYVRPQQDKDDGLFDRCPDLLTSLPSGMRVADEATIHRAYRPLPTLKRGRASVYLFGVPTVAPDGRTADVVVTLVCSGTCGGQWIIRFRRRGSTWVRDGKPVLRWVS